MHFSIGEISPTIAEKKSGKNPPHFFGVLDVSLLGMITLYEDNCAMNGRQGAVEEWNQGRVPISRIHVQEWNEGRVPTSHIQKAKQIS